MTILSGDKADAVVDAIAHEVVDSTVDKLLLSVQGTDSTTGAALVTVSVDGKERSISRLAMLRLMKAIGVPPKALEEYSDATETLKAMLQHSQAKRGKALIRLSVTEGVVTGVGKPSLTTMTLSEVWQYVRKRTDVVGILGVDRLPNDRFGLRVVMDTKCGTSANSFDESYAGVYVTLGSKVNVAPLVYRQNARSVFMMVNDGSELTVEGTPVADGFERTLLASYVVAKEVLREYVRSDDNLVDNGVDYANRVLRVVGVGSSNRQKIIDLAQTELKRPTIYSVVNLVAGFAKTFENVKRRISMENTAGDILAVQAGSISCSRCGAHL